MSDGVDGMNLTALSQLRLKKNNSGWDPLIEAYSRITDWKEKESTT